MSFWNNLERIGKNAERNIAINKKLEKIANATSKELRQQIIDKDNSEMEVKAMKKYLNETDPDKKEVMRILISKGVYDF